MNLRLCRNMKKQVEKVSSIGETLVLLENRNRKMFRPRNQEVMTGNSFIVMVSNSGLIASLVLS